MLRYPDSSRTGELGSSSVDPYPTQMPTRAEAFSYLSRAYSSQNANKVRGIKAELDFQQYIDGLAPIRRYSPGGWILRPNRVPDFGLAPPVALFPTLLQVGASESSIAAENDAIRNSVPAVAAKLQDAGIHAYLCSPADKNGTAWQATSYGGLVPGGTVPIVRAMKEAGFNVRTKPYNFLKYEADVSGLRDSSDLALARLMSAESLRVAVHSGFFAEVNDIDTVIWGKDRVYPAEIKEKTRATDAVIGDWFGLDVGPFAKLAFYAANYQRFSSLFIVREIDSTAERNLVDWRVSDFGTIARRASWVGQGGGKGMSGGRSAVVKVPAGAFRRFDAAFLTTLD
jgi:hypothetical protein